MGFTSVTKYIHSRVVRLRLEGKLVIITTREADGATFGRVGQSVCLSVCVCVCLCVLFVL